MLLRNENFKLWVAEVSLRLEPWKVSEEHLIVVTGKVSFSDLLAEDVLDDILGFLLTEKFVRVYFVLCFFIKVFYNFFAPRKLGVGIIDENSTHFLTALLLNLLLLLRRWSHSWHGRACNNVNVLCISNEYIILI